MKIIFWGHIIIWGPNEPLMLRAPTHSMFAGHSSSPKATTPAWSFNDGWSTIFPLATERSEWPPPSASLPFSSSTPPGSRGAGLLGASATSGATGGAPATVAPDRRTRCSGWPGTAPSSSVSPPPCSVPPPRGPHRRSCGPMDWGSRLAGRRWRKRLKRTSTVPTSSQVREPSTPKISV